MNVCEICWHTIPDGERFKICYATGRTCCMDCDDPDDAGCGYQISGRVYVPQPIIDGVQTHWN